MSWLAFKDSSTKLMNAFDITVKMPLVLSSCHYKWQYHVAIVHEVTVSCLAHAVGSTNSLSFSLKCLTTTVDMLKVKVSSFFCF